MNDQRYPYTKSSEKSDVEQVRNVIKNTQNDKGSCIIWEKNDSKIKNTQNDKGSCIIWEKNDSKIKNKLNDKGSCIIWEKNDYKN